MPDVPEFASITIFIHHPLRSDLCLSVFICGSIPTSSKHWDVGNALAMVICLLPFLFEVGLEVGVRILVDVCLDRDDNIDGPAKLSHGRLGEGLQPVEAEFALKRRRHTPIPDVDQRDVLQAEKMSDLVGGRVAQRHDDMCE